MTVDVNLCHVRELGAQQTAVVPRRAASTSSFGRVEARFAFDFGVSTLRFSACWLLYPLFSPCASLFLIF